MKITVKKGSITQEAAEIIVLTHFAEEDSLLPDTEKVDRAMGGHIRELLRSGEFSGKANQTAVIHTHGKISSKRVLLVGLGKRADSHVEKIRQAMGKAASQIREMGLKSLCTPVHGRDLSGILIGKAAQTIVEGALLGLYQFTLYKTEEKPKGLDEIILIETDPKKLPEIQSGITRGQIIAEATNYARDLANNPANVVTPTRLAEEARAIATEYGMRCEVLERADMERLGMGALLGVARGTQEPPKFIILEHKGNTKDRPIVLAGKSVTFDSGGISLKPSEKMEQMKDDMSGGAAVLAIFRAVGRLQLPVNLIGLLPATDNMPSGTAIHPGDVVKTLSGKTVEVINTDAEGRLCLADALFYATRYTPAAIIDVATLTGACVVALGNHAIGLMGNNPALISRIKEAGEKSGERVWELPLWEEYFEQIKSDVADLKNVGGRPAGMITAGAFLMKFVGDYPWAHLDIAGTAWTDEARPYNSKGATGAGVRLLSQFLLDYAEKKK